MNLKPVSLRQKQELKTKLFAGKKPCKQVNNFENRKAFHIVISLTKHYSIND